jgi:hypothetical protein
MEDILLHSQAIKVLVILNSKDNWWLWYKAMKTSIILAGIWEYINPNTIPKPVVPQQPAIPEALGLNKLSQQYKPLSDNI